MAQILVVDDDLSVADAIDRTLRGGGHQTIVVHNGWDAIETARTRNPDLLVLDIVMPGMDGIEVCKRLRTDPETAHLPIIFLTARAMIEDKIAGFEAGADDYLTKPFAIQELDLRVRALLRRTHSDQVSGTGSGFDKEQEEEVLVIRGLRLNRRTFQVSTANRTAILTPIEFELLNHLMEHAGEVFSSERLLQEVWNYPSGTGDPALVRMHIRNIRAKIEPEGISSPVYICTVSRRGYTVPTGSVDSFE
jgi:DNA-binding response OmpR family regulator